MENTFLYYIDPNGGYFVSEGTSSTEILSYILAVPTDGSRVQLSLTNDIVAQENYQFFSWTINNTNKLYGEIYEVAWNGSNYSLYIDDIERATINSGDTFTANWLTSNEVSTANNTIGNFQSITSYVYYNESYVKAVPYVYTGSGWAKVAPQICTNT